MNRKSHSHSHSSGAISIDIYAQKSRLNRVNPSVKLGFSLIVLLLCVGSQSPFFCLFVGVTMVCFIVLLGKTPLGYVVKLIKLPIFFILISCGAIVINFSKQPLGFLDLSFFGGYLSVTKHSLAQGGRMFFKAYGAVSCMYFLSLSTPMQELIAAMGKLHLPKIFIELMYLIYRYIFLLMEVQREMTVSAKSRLGYWGYKNSIYTLTHISGNLLGSAFKRSRDCFDSMEARCYEGNLGFLHSETPIKLCHTVPMAAYIALLMVLW
ncbi:MAG: cobalt ECF transporter T component CbiQ [Oscillospiraceae bacterium]